MVKEVNYQKQNKHASNQMVEASKKSSPYKASWIEQFRALLWRSFLSVMKEPMIVKVNLIQTIVISLILGIIYMNQEYDQKGASNINGALFIIITNLNFSNVFGVVNVSFIFGNIFRILLQDAFFRCSAWNYPSL